MTKQVKVLDTYRHIDQTLVTRVKVLPCRVKVATHSNPLAFEVINF